MQLGTILTHPNTGYQEEGTGISLSTSPLQEAASPQPTLQLKLTFLGLCREQRSVSQCPWPKSYPLRVVEILMTVKKLSVTPMWHK